MMDGSENNRFLTVEEVALLLRKKERTIREWCYNKSIPHYKIGNSLLFNIEEINEWITENCRVDMSNTANAKEEPERHHPIYLVSPKLKIEEDRKE